MRPDRLIKNGDGLQDTGLVIESLNELLTLGEAAEFANTHIATYDLLDGFYPALAAGVKAMVEKVAQSDKQVNYPITDEVGGGLALTALLVTAEDHPQESTRNSAKAMVASYDNAVLELKFADESIPPKTV